MFLMADPSQSGVSLDFFAFLVQVPGFLSYLRSKLAWILPFSPLVELLMTFFSCARQCHCRGDAKLPRVGLRSLSAV